MALSQLKPRKPHPNFPLTPHPNGQWCKKIRGQLRFFGVWSNPSAALERYLLQAADLHAGQDPTLPTENVSVKQLANQYLAYQSDRLSGGEIGARWFEDCRRILKDFSSVVGKTRDVTDLRPSDFQSYRTRLSRRLGVYAITRAITVVKGAFKYAVESGLIGEAPRLQHALRKPTAAQIRKSRQEAELTYGKKLFSPDQIRQIIEASPETLHAAILLGINGGFGNTDCGTLPIGAVQFEGSVIEYHRPKTGVQRIVPLWSETVEALRAIMDSDRPTPQAQEDSRLVFLTETGRPMVRQRTHRANGGEISRVSHMDRISSLFNELLEKLGMKRRRIGFYTLRHTFRTWADETNDQHAIHRIMGHAIPGMSGIYVEEIELKRLRAVVDHVHQKLFGAASHSTISLSRTSAREYQPSASTTD